ncbi:MAG: hypothetical protein LBM87_02070 [Ruminococcus sp.]|nr:hypothetical protein [Ruminococcus sp.]
MNLNKNKKIIFCELEERHLPSLMKLYEQFGFPIDTDYDYTENSRKSLDRE